MVTLWAIWTARRKLIHEGINQSPLSTHLFVTSFIAELEQIHQKEPLEITRVQGRNAHGHWLPRPMGSIKINVDAGVSVSRNLGTAAAVCRDRDGGYLGSSVLVIGGLLDAPSLEAIACREALALAQDLGMHFLSIGSDCKQVINHINQSAGGNYGGIIREMNEYSRSFSRCVFNFESRVPNFEAHRLARFGISLSPGRHVWLEAPHDVNSIPVHFSNIFNKA